MLPFFNFFKGRAVALWIAVVGGSSLAFKKEQQQRMFVSTPSQAAIDALCCVGFRTATQ
eukprot:m.58517 g.58517  ORF g.58517 m.58517 type:complete len:59 (-) comp11266_c0_seq3:106-282(-)